MPAASRGGSRVWTVVAAVVAAATTCAAGAAVLVMVVAGPGHGELREAGDALVLPPEFTLVHEIATGNPL